MVFPPFAAARAPRVSDRSSVFFPDSPGEIRRRFNLDWQSLNLRLSTPVSSANITPFTDRHCGLSHASDASGDCRALRCGNHPSPGIPGRQGFSGRRVRRRARGGPSIQDED